MQESFYSPNSTADSFYNIADRMTNKPIDFVQRQVMEMFKNGLKEYKGSQSAYIAEFITELKAWQASVGVHDHSPERILQMSLQNISPVQPVSGTESEGSPQLLRLLNPLSHIESQSKPRSNNPLNKPKVHKNTFKIRAEAQKPAQKPTQEEQSMFDLSNNPANSISKRRQELGANEEKPQRAVVQLHMTPNPRNTQESRNIFVYQEKPQPKNKIPTFRLRTMEAQKALGKEFWKQQQKRSNEDSEKKPKQEIKQ